MNPLIKIESISRSFNSIKAVSNISFSIFPGEIYGLIGPDGSGKTTTIRMSMGAILMDSGNIFINSIDVKNDPEKAREYIGYMPQAYSLYPDLSVMENLRFFSELHSVSKTIFQKRSSEILEFIRLDKFKDRKAGALSGGMYKKLAIGCAIIHSPSIMILDEPTNGVDPVSRRDLWALLFSLSASGVAILVSTPYMDEAERCHRVGLLSAGELIKEGEPSQLLSSLKSRLFGMKTANNVDAISILKKELTGYTVYTSINSIHIVSKQKESISTIETLVKNILDKHNIITNSIQEPDPVFEDLFMGCIT